MTNIFSIGSLGCLWQGVKLRHFQFKNGGGHYNCCTTVKATVKIATEIKSKLSFKLRNYDTAFVSNFSQSNIYIIPMCWELKHDGYHLTTSNFVTVITAVVVEITKRLRNKYICYCCTGNDHMYRCMLSNITRTNNYFNTRCLKYDNWPMTMCEMRTSQWTWVKG